jgi:hypothetical protein
MAACSVETAVRAEDDVVVAVRPRAVVGDLAYPRDEGLVGRDDHARVAEGAEVLRRVEAEAGGVAEGPRPPPSPFGPVGLRRVREDGKPVPPRDLADRGRVGRVPVEVHGQDHLGARRDGGLEPLRVHRVGLGVHVHEHRPGSGEQDGLAGSDERVRHRDHLVPGPTP